MKICEKSIDREGIVKLGVGSGSGLGFLRWWSLIKECILSAIRVSSGVKEMFGSFLVSLLFVSSSSLSEVEEE